MVKRLTLGFIINDGKILLGMKKRGFGAGKWNGFGGKVEGGESPLENMKREYGEEVGITVRKAEPRGRLIFNYNHLSDVYVVHVFNIQEYTGEIAESEEMAPKWFPIEEIPYNEMWSDDPYWLPRFLNGEEVNAAFQSFSFDKIIPTQL